MSKKVCVVSAADYSYWWSVRGDCVAQALVGYKNIKTSLPGDVYIRRAFHGDIWYSAPRGIRQTLPQATTGTHPTCPHGTHRRSSSSPTISWAATTSLAEGCAQRPFCQKSHPIFPIFCVTSFLFQLYSIQFSLRGFFFPLLGFLFPLYLLQVSSQSRNLLRHRHYTLVCLLSQPHGAVWAIFSSAVPVPDGHRTSYTSLAVPVPSRSQLERLYTVSPVHKICTSPLWPD